MASMKKMSKQLIVLSLALSVALALPAAGAFAATKSAAKTVKKPAKALTVADLSGRLVIEKDSFNKIWYVDPASKERYYLNTEADLKLVTDNALKPAAKEFRDIAKTAKSKTTAAMIKKYSGRFIVGPADKKIYYLNPGDNIAYVVTNHKDFVGWTAKVIGLPAADSLLRQIAMNSVQLTYDPAFYGTAAVKFDGTSYSGGQNSDVILPLASLSKVMTALVFLDTKPDWNKQVQITPEEIKYPCTLQACGTTSEIPLKAGDYLLIKDLWVAMLAASSNQSAVILADNSGLTRAEFVAKMNEKAKALGLKKTHFEEMTGLSADNISTAEEFAVIARTAFMNEAIAEATRQTDYNFEVVQTDSNARSVHVANRNTSLLAMNPLASKSGYLVEAQRNAAVLRDGQVAVALHCYSLAQRNDTIKRLLDGDEVSLGGN